MNTLEIREQVKNFIDQLSEEKLLVAADFLAYLTEKENQDATEELLAIEGFHEAFTNAKQNVEKGKVVPIEQLKRKY